MSATSESQPTPREGGWVYLKIIDRIRGPFDQEQCAALLKAGTLTAESSASTSPEGPWIPFRELREANVHFPKRSALSLKRPETYPLFVSDDPTASIDHRDLIAHGATPRQLGASPVLQPKNDVERLVGNLTDQMKATEPPFVVQRPRRRRLWDFLAATVVSNVLVSILFLGVAGHSLAMVSFLPLLLAPLDAGLVWIFFVVLGRY